MSHGESVEFKGAFSQPYDPIESIWLYLPCGPFENPAKMREHYEKQINQPASRVFTLFENESNIQIGSFSYANSSPDQLRVDIGGVWVSPVAHQAGLSSEATYLLIEKAFELGYRKIEWKCCTSNKKSTNFALKIGFSLEIFAPERFVFKNILMDASYFGLFRDDWNDNLKEKARRLLDDKPR